MNLRHPLFSVLLAVLLAFTSVTMAVARVQDRMSMAVELCTDGTVQTIAVDGQGNPLGPHHSCPDCLMGVTAGMLPEGAVALVLALQASRVSYGAHKVTLLPVATPHPSARGPPDLM